MADILISKFTTQIPRVGATPATPGFAESEGQDPVNPSGSPLVYTHVTIGTPANGMSINPTTQVLTIGLASTSATGALSSTDWNTFNNKLNLTSPITGYTVGANTALADTDTILQAFGKVQGQINARISGTLTSGRVPFATGANTLSDDSGLTWNNTSKSLTLQNYSVTGSGSNSALSINGTWNTTGTPNAISMNITDTASNGNSSLMLLQVGGNSRFRILKNGDINFGSSVVAGIVTSGGSFDIRSSANNGIDDLIFQNGLVGSKTHTSGNFAAFSIRFNYQPTSGNGSYSIIRLQPIINQTGGANGATRGVHIAPTLTSAADWRSIDWGNNSGWGLYGSGTANNYLGGDLWIRTTSGTNTLDVNGTARIRTISNLGTAATSVLVPSATGVVSLRTLAELASDGLGSKWTDVTGGIFRNGAVAVGRTTIPTNATLAVQSLTTTGTHEFFQILNNTGTQIFTINNNNVSQFKLAVTTFGNPTSLINTGATFKSNSDASEAIFRIMNASETLRFEVWGTGQIRCYSHFIAVGNSISSFALQGATFKGNSSTTGEIFKIMNSSESSIFSVLGNGTITYLDGSNWSLGTTTGTRIGTATNQRLSFWNKTPIVQPTNAIGAAAFVANTSGIANDTATYGGYTMGQIAQALINVGILA